MTQPGTPAVFVHGLWLHAGSWGPWLELFQEAGYTPTAPGWPGDSDTVEEARRDPSQVAGKGIDDVVDHYAGIIRGLQAPPVVIGHSFGGLIAQRLLGQDLAAAAVAIDAAPIKGVLNLPVCALKVASIALRKPANRNLAISLTPEQFRYGFGNALPEQESAELYDRWTVPSPGKPPVRSRPGELHPAVASESEYRQQDSRAAAARDRGQRSHRAAGHHDVDPQALPQVTGHHRLHRVPRSRPLADDRPRLARGRAGSAGLA
jgi:non-heme chloroperoxidase